MIKRRLAFATPFVMVIGCKTPAAVEPREDERTKREEAPVVVNLGPPIDAAVPAVPDEPAQRPDASVLGEGDPPAPTIRALLVETAPDGYEGSVLTFDAGTKRGVTARRASARLLDGDTDRPLHGGQIKITECTLYWCRGMVTLRPDVVERNPHVEIGPKDQDADRTFVETRRQVTCCVNPPPPKRQPPQDQPPYRDPGPTGNPPPPRRVRIVRSEVMDLKTVITIAAGTENDVRRGRSSVCVVDDNNRCLPNGIVTLIRCDQRTCVGTVTLTRDQVTANPNVQVRYRD